MTDEEMNVRANLAASEGRMLEAAWIKTMLASAPEELSEGHLMMVRVGFYRGAQSALEIMRLAAGEKDHRVAQTVMRDIAKEMAVFFRVAAQFGKDMLKKREQQNQSVRH
jgi:hypothetical protein